ARKDNFHAAEEFFRLAMACKEHCHDDLGRLHARLELGRLYLAWGELDRAEEQFQQNLLESPRHDDNRGKAIALDFLGLVALKRGNRAAAGGKKAVAQRHWNEAAELLDASIRGHREDQHPVDEAYAHKERARVAL